jgi:hypothetical protein
MNIGVDASMQSVGVFAHVGFSGGETGTGTGGLLMTGKELGLPSGGRLFVVMTVARLARGAKASHAEHRQMAIERTHRARAGAPTEPPPLAVRSTRMRPC